MTAMLEWAVCHKCREPITVTAHWTQHGKALWALCPTCYADKRKKRQPK